MYATAEPDYRTRSVELVAVRVAADSKVAVTTSAGVPSTPCLPKHGAPPPPTNGACHNVTLDKCSDGPGVPNPTEVVVEVAAAAGGTETYRVAIGCTLGPPTVSMLSFWPGVLSPKFSPSIQNYTLSLPNSSVSAVTHHLQRSGLSASHTASRSRKCAAALSCPPQAQPMQGLIPVYVYMYICLCTYVHLYIYIYIYIHI